MLAKLLIEILKVNERLSILFTYIDIIHSDCMQYEQLINVPAQMKIQIFRYNELFSNIWVTYLGYLNSEYETDK